jgi:hypothetical protein
VGPRAEYSRLLALLARVDRVNIKRWRVIITDAPIGDDQVLEVTKALNRTRIR